MGNTSIFCLTFHQTFDPDHDPSSIPTVNCHQFPASSKLESKSAAANKTSLARCHRLKCSHALGEFFCIAQANGPFALKLVEGTLLKEKVDFNFVTNLIEIKVSGQVRQWGFLKTSENYDDSVDDSWWQWVDMSSLILGFIMFLSALPRCRCWWSNLSVSSRCWAVPEESTWASHGSRNTTRSLGTSGTSSSQTKLYVYYTCKRPMSAT